MPKIIPTSFTAPSPVRYASGQPILNTNASDISEAQHHIFAKRVRSAIMGRVFDPPALISSTSYTKASSTGDDLFSFDAGARFDRLCKVSTNLFYRVTVVFIGADLDMRLTVQQPGSSAALAVATVTGSTFAKATSTLVYSASPARAFLEWKTNSTSGRCAGVQVIEEALVSAAFLPEG